MRMRVLISTWQLRAVTWMVTVRARRWKAVERVLSGAVNKVLSKFKASTELSTASRFPSTSRPRTQDREDSIEPTASTTRSSKHSVRDNASSDSDNFQLLPKKLKER